MANKDLMQDAAKAYRLQDAGLKVCRYDDGWEKDLPGLSTRV